ncbi:MAG: iron-containing alcohol dehydrogenase [Anaerolineales bacterium]|nr:iron-containing alcohol dehydrogenase [Anaerolineales bacterium]
MIFETAFTMSTTHIKFGPGTTSEIGSDMQKLGCKRVMVVTDPHLASMASVQTVLDALREASIEAALFSAVQIEPTDYSFQEAIAFATEGQFDGYVAIGGGSVIDTAKVANLYSTYPAEFYAYVNQPIGEGRAVPGPVKPLIAIPTTAGTGSEATGVAVFDITARNLKTGISHTFLRPSLGIIDPENTRTLPPLVAACTGLDVLCHAVESLTAIPYNQRPATPKGQSRPTYQGANPISDVWSATAIQLVASNLLRVIEDSSDDAARGNMMLAAALAGIGFGNAGVHLPHAMAYPIAGMARDYQPAGYNADHPLIPHGMSVILNAPATFRLTAGATPEAHLRAAALMGVDTSKAKPEDAGELLAGAFIDIMQRTQMPNGLAALGFTADDIPQMAEGAFAQQRLVKLSPRSVTQQDFEQLFAETMTIW